MQSFVVGYKFDISHHERHYLMNPRGRRYGTSMTRDKSKAMRFLTQAAALEAMEMILDKSDRGQSMGYYFVSFVETV